MSQGRDEDLLISIAAIVLPGSIERDANDNRLRIKVEGSPKENPDIASVAAGTFQTLLGILRVLRVDAGVLEEELRAGLGAGSARDEAGNHYVMVEAARLHSISGGEVEGFSEVVRAAIDNSQRLSNALWLNGSTNRTAPAYYMIYELAEMEFDGPNGLRDALAISPKDQDRFTHSANRLSPIEGGRHAKQTGSAPWGLAEMRGFSADLLRRWIDHAASK